MAKSLSITPAAKPIKAYYAALRDFAHQQIDHEQAVRSAFQTLLADLARPLKWTAIPELGRKSGGRQNRVVPDGTLQHKNHLPRGYWEAKDSADNLNHEIADKVGKGYPTDNTIFWTPGKSVLFRAKKTGGFSSLGTRIGDHGRRIVSIGVPLVGRVQHA